MIDIAQRMKVRDFLASIDADYAAKIKSAFPGAGDGETPYIRRAFTPEDIQFAEDEKAIIGTITSLARDWYNEVVLPEGMNKSVYNGVVLYNHDYDTKDIPHARNMWIKPTADKAAIVAKTAYITDLSDLGNKVYQYRTAKHPMGQSIGFMPLEWKSKRDEDWEKVYKKWVKRYTEYMLGRGAKASKIDTSEPDLIYTKWALLEYSDVFVPANPDAMQIAVSNGLILEEDVEEYTIKSVIPYKDLGKAAEDADWDAGAEVSAAEVADLKLMCTWYDAENGDTKGAYKLPHHKASGHAAVWRGVAAAMGALLGARGGVDVPDGDRKGIYNHLSRHYAAFDKDVPEFKDYTEAELKEMFSLEDSKIDRLCRDVARLEAEIADLRGQLNTEEEEKLNDAYAEAITAAMRGE